MKRATFITWEQLKVGVVILIALSILTVAVYRLGRAANLFTDRYVLVAFLQSAGGLRVGGSVAVAGQIAGSVRRIDFLPPDADTTRNLMVLMEIDRSLQGQIRENSTARLRTLGLLGDKIIDISPGTVPYAVLEEGDTIRVSPSLDYEQVLSEAAGAVDDMVLLTHDLRSLTGGLVRGEGTMGQLLTNRTLYDELTTTLTRTNALLVRLQNPRGTIGRLIDDPRLYDQLTGMIVQLDTLLRKVQHEQGTVGRLLGDTTLYHRMLSMATSADSVMTLLANGDGFASQMLRDQTLYDRLNKLVTDLNVILEDVRRDPGRYTKGMIKVF